MIRRLLWPVFLRGSTHSGTWRAPLPGVLLCCLAHQALKEAPLVGSYSVLWRISHLKGHPGWGPTLQIWASGTERGTLGGVLLCSSVHQAFDRPASLLFSCGFWLVGGERLWWWLHPLRVTQQYRLASMAAWLSSTGISHHSLLPHIPSTHLSAVNSSPHPGIAPQSLNSSSQPLRLPGDYIPVQGMYGCAKSCLILIPFRLPQISCLTLSLKCFSSDSDNCPDVGIGPLLQIPHPSRAGPALTGTPVFPSSSFFLRNFAWVYVFFSAGQVLLSALSWCSVCTSVSEGVFLMYPRREIHSTSTYSSNILFSSYWSLM